MNFQDILSDLLTENQVSRKLLQTMTSKWFGPDATEEDYEKTQEIIEKFFSIRNKLNANAAEVITFRRRFRTFDVKAIKDITKYTKEEVAFILHNYNISIRSEKNVHSTLPETLNGPEYRFDEQTVEDSKQLWFDKRDNLIIDEGGIRVYYIRDRREAKAYGFYSQSIAKGIQQHTSLQGASRWCVTWPASNNMWASYRDRRTFYFVIDENRPTNDRYYVSALQYDTQSAEYGSTFRLTSVLNDGDIIMDERMLAAVYPQLIPHLDKIKPVRYNTQELGEIIDEVDLITEETAYEYEFASVAMPLKERYIDRGKFITKAASWNSMTSMLKKKYIDMTQKTNVFERFASKELIRILTEKTSERNSVDRRLKIVGYPNGFMELTAYLMNTDYLLDIRRGINSHGHIALYKSKTTGLFGIFNKRSGDWLEKGGIRYEDDFREDKENVDYHITEDGTFFDVVTYTSDNASFVVLIPEDDEDGYNGYFLSSRMWDKLKDEIDGAEDIDTTEDGFDDEDAIAQGNEIDDVRD